jgi:acetyl-CoA carboxylase biotin carboxyl carrier protein
MPSRLQEKALSYCARDGLSDKMLPSQGGQLVDIEDLKKIIDLLKHEGLSEITLWEGEHRITVRQEIVARSTSPRFQAEKRVGIDEDTFTLNAPLVGTFYRRPSPDEDPFVAEGTPVDLGDTLCIIEAMKVMNEIKAEAPGEVEEILVEDGDSVEFGQPLFRLKRP